ncbi:MAG: KEOPS complex subunit Pcc1 [Candidatus Micrarchaeota archaeon]
MKARCSIAAVFPDDKSAGAAMEAVSHEGGVGSRSDAKLSVKDRTLNIEISATDVVALRASANAYMRALAAIEGIDTRCEK